MTAIAQIAPLASAVPVQLRDGRVLSMRPLGDGERQPVLEVFENMSPRSRYLRFLSPMPGLTEPMVRLLTRLDGRDRVAWAAYSGACCVGIVRFVRWADRPEAAELAISVVDEFHRRGVGRRLLGVLASVALARGIATFTLTVHPENRGSLALVRSFPIHLRIVEGLYEGELSAAAIVLDERIRQQVDLDAVVRLADVEAAYACC